MKIPVRIKSTTTVNKPSSRIESETSTVEPFNSSHVGQVHFLNSSIVNCQYVEKRFRYPRHQRNPKITATTATKISVFVMRSP